MLKTATINDLSSNARICSTFGVFSALFALTFGVVCWLPRSCCLVVLAVTTAPDSVLDVSYGGSGERTSSMSVEGNARGRSRYALCKTLSKETSS